MRNTSLVVRLGIIATAVAILGGCATRTRNPVPCRAAANVDDAGHIYANCDNGFVLYVNNREVLRNNNWETPPPPVSATLMPGDVISVRVSDFGGAYGFAFLYCSNDRTKFFSANTNTWHTYAPSDPVAWWHVPDVAELGLAPATDGNNKSVAAELQFQADAPCTNVIWGETGEATAFLLHVVTDSDLRKQR